MKPGRVFLVLLSFFLMAIPPARAAIRPEDFVCRGIALGQATTEEELAGAFGAPLFDDDRSVFGIRVRYYTFRKDFAVGLTASDGKVADIVIRNRDYQARDGVRYGATAYKIKTTYGKVDRVFLDGKTLYIYENPEDSGQRLLIEAEPPQGTLLSFRITSLPLTAEEAEGHADEEWESRDLGAIEMREYKIDMSALEARDRAEEAGRRL